VPLLVIEVSQATAVGCFRFTNLARRTVGNAKSGGFISRAAFPAAELC
jgi:hypothetical protein